ncbi:LPP20 family lipoprotein [Archangium lipolyticum]|uniref:LPP20 family lipoprotein n=1 Tax=Archangium lipolyticum TaxID=2970465 RepID=UPI002149D704|nr:LPP20 family lipoprotein [Archangium lipolyticum]
MRRALWALVLAAPLSALAQGNGVDWQRQVLRVTGDGPPDVKASNPSQARLGAERSAKEDALADLLEQVKGLRLRADRTVGEELAREETRRKVEDVLRGYKVIQKRYYSDSGVQLDVEVPLGALTAVLVTAAPAPVEAAAPAETKPAETKPAGAKKEAKAKFTGLVVDARKLGMTPVLAPRLLDDAGQPLYGEETLSPEARKLTGVAGFFRSLEQARKSELVGARPLVLEAARLQGSDLQLGPDAAKTLAGFDSRLLAEGRVAILIK